MIRASRQPRRQSDHPAWNWALGAGLLTLPAAFALKAFGLLDRNEFWGALVFAAFCIRPDRLVDLVRARFGASQSTSSEPPESGS
jgi:hypothetical protein